MQWFKTKLKVSIANGNFSLKQKVTERFSCKQNSSVQPNFEKIFYHGNEKMAKLKIVTKQYKNKIQRRAKLSDPSDNEDSHIT